MSTTYPIEAIRTLALHTQALTSGNGHESPPDAEAIYKTIEQIGCLQIDTLQRVARAHYLTLWSRLGTYSPQMLDYLAYHPQDRLLFEGWQHAACLIPLREYRYQMPKQRALREGPNDWYTRWLANIHHAETVAFVRARVKKEGALKVSDFKKGEHPPGAWWNWRPAKVALEYLYAQGEFMIANRQKFQRVYNLTERVLPTWVDTTEPSEKERDHFWVERGGKALGIFAERHACDYTWMKLGKGRAIVREMVKKGVFVKIHGQVHGGEKHELLVHRDNLALLEQAADGELRAARTTFLNPFDNLFWAQGRDELFWGFWQRLEAYTPAPKRIYGYFSLPILHNTRLVGRFDPQLERKNGLLRLCSLHLEAGVEPDDELAAAIAVAMRDFMSFHKASQLTIEQSNPPEFASKLMKAIGL